MYTGVDSTTSSGWRQSSCSIVADGGPGEVAGGQRVVVDDRRVVHACEVEQERDRDAGPVLARSAADDHGQAVVGEERPDHRRELLGAGVEHVAVHPREAAVRRRVVGEQRDRRVADAIGAHEHVRGALQLLGPAEVDDLAHAELDELLLGVGGQPGELVRSEQRPPAHPPSAGRRIAADVADVAGPVQRQVARGCVDHPHRVAGSEPLGVERSRTGWSFRGMRDSRGHAVGWTDQLPDGRPIAFHAGPALEIHAP